MSNNIKDIEPYSKEWSQIAFAFYSLSCNDLREWEKLPDNLKESRVGLLCQKYIDTLDYKYIQEAGYILAGSHWHIALGRTF